MIKLGRVSKETKGLIVVQGRVEDYTFCQPGVNEPAKPGCGA